jgi:hypothetical protein
MLVSDFLTCCRSARKLCGPAEVTRYVESMLKNRTVRIIYRRQNYEGGKDMNAEHSRVKIFKHFGVVTSKQLFYEVSQDEDGKKSTEDSDHDTTVYDLLTRRKYPGLQLKY